MNKATLLTFTKQHHFDFSENAMMPFFQGKVGPRLTIKPWTEREMSYEKEITALSAETLALGAIVSFVLARIAKADPAMSGAVAAGFDDAGGYIEQFAINAGKTVPSEHTAKALRIVEELRTVTVGDHDQRRHGV